MARRVELTFTEDEYGVIESARGEVPRATWLKARALEAALSGESPTAAGGEREPEGASVRQVPSATPPGAPPRAPGLLERTENAKTQAELDRQYYERRRGLRR